MSILNYRNGSSYIYNPLFNPEQYRNHSWEWITENQSIVCYHYDFEQRHSIIVIVIENDNQIVNVFEYNQNINFIENNQNIIEVNAIKNKYLDYLEWNYPGNNFMFNLRNPIFNPDETINTLVENLGRRS